MPKRRPQPAKDVETEVLTRSRRRCCLCFALKFDTSYKRIQIAHADGNPENNRVDNLVALCQEHHDSTPSQTKGITINELKSHRDELYKVLAQKDEQVRLELISSPGIAESTAMPSARLLGQALSAFDREMFKTQSGNRPNGIALARIGQFALEEEGDFDVVKEVFISLIRLSTSTEHEAYLYGQTPIRHATPFPLAMRILLDAIETDLNLFMDLLNKARMHAWIGDDQFITLSNYGKIPNESFGVITGILCGTCMEIANTKSDWALNVIVEVLCNILAGLGFVLSSLGFNLPDPPAQVWYTISCERTVPDGEPQELMPLIRLIHRMAFLPQKAFDYAISNLKYAPNLTEKHLTVNVDNTEAYDEDMAIKLIKSWSVVPGHGLIAGYFSVKDEATKQKYTNVIRRNVELGSRAVTIIRDTLVAERKHLQSHPS